MGTPISDLVDRFANGKKFFKIKLSIDIKEAIKDKVNFLHPLKGETTAYLVYEKLGRLCNFCGRLGHELNSCADRTKLVRIKNSMKAQERPELKGILNPIFGPWRVSAAMIPVTPSPQKSNLGQEGPESAQNTSNTPTTGTKRSLNDILNPFKPDNHLGIENGLFLLQAEVASPKLAPMETSSTPSSLKRAKAAKPQLPPGFQ